MMARESTQTVRPTRSVNRNRFGSISMLPSKTRPTTSPSRLMTGLPELPPMMSLVATALSGAARSSRATADAPQERAGDELAVRSLLVLQLRQPRRDRPLEGIDHPGQGHERVGR